MKILLWLTAWIPGGALAATLCLDAGHGGSDPGAVGCNLQEKAINLDVVKRLQTLLTQNGFGVLLTRADDSTVSLQARTDYANAHNADRFVSVHSNSSDPPGTGIETYCHLSPSAQAVDLRDKIQEEMVAAWPLRNRGGKTADFYVLRETDMPATLSELGFINNCENDARYLGDATHRQEAAQAHLQAILRHFGTQPHPTGTLRGVVFLDRGQGSADMSTRLSGATVAVEETGDSAVAADANANWSFVLPPGNYTVRASLSGYRDNRRSCSVTANAETWCSIGLFEDTLPDAGPLDGGADAGPGDDGGTGGDAPTPDGGEALPDQETPREPGGCGCGGLDPAPSLTIGPLALLLFLLRRRVAAAAMLLMCFGPLSSQPLEEAPAAHLESVLAGDWTAPVLSPDGKGMLLTRSGFDGLFYWDIGQDAPRQISALPRSGYLPGFSRDGRAVLRRLRGREFDGTPPEMLSLDGRPLGPSPVTGPRAVMRGDEIWWEQDGDAQRLDPGRDRYFAPRLSPDGAHAVFQGLSSGLHLFRRADGRHFALGGGGQGAFSGDGRFLVFARARDDGHRLTGSSLFLVDLRQAEPAPRRIALPPELIPLHPSLSGDGSLLAFASGGAVHTARLERDR